MSVNKFKVGDVVKCVDDSGVKINLTTDKISNVTIPCLITGVLKMLIVIVIMIIICLLMAKVGE